MDKKLLYVVGILVVLVAALAVVFTVSGDEDENLGDPEVLDNADLKVFGNINGDRFINETDVKMIEKLIDEGKTAGEFPLADANQDKVLDSKDVDLVKKIVAGEKCIIWHVNYYDIEHDGIMDMPIVSTQFPVTSAITHGSTNNLIFLYSLGIVDELKGLTYSYSIDKGLFEDVYMDPAKCEKLSGNTEGIDFEDGKAGSSDIIQREHVTCVVANWNHAQMSKWESFENAGVDVVRVAPGSTEKPVLMHSAMLIGLLFQKADRASDFIDMNFKIFDMVADKTKNVTKVKAAASSSNNRVSSEDSDYFGVVKNAGGLYGLDGIDFGGKGSIKISEHPEIFSECDFEKFIHIRSKVNYAADPATAIQVAKESAAGYSDWKYSETGQYHICGTMPVCLRVAYTACALYPDAIGVDEVDDLHKQYIDQFYNGKTFDVDNIMFIVTPKDLLS